jgi:hypothetical protein
VVGGPHDGLGPELCWTASFEPSTSSVRAARSFVLDTPPAHVIDGPDLGLLVSEAASNAIFHARSTFTVRVTALHDGIRVEVGDTSHDLPDPQPVDPQRASGRGLLIIEALARSWGSHATGTGKVVWFEVGST